MSYIKKAEQNVINQAKAFQDMLEVCKALQSFGFRACHEHVAQRQFFDGLEMMRKAIYAEQNNALANCFALACVGGDDAAEFSRELFEKTFLCSTASIAKLLDEWGQLPSCWVSDEIKQFKEESKEKLK